MASSIAKPDALSQPLTRSAATGTAPAPAPAPAPEPGVEAPRSLVYRAAGRVYACDVTHVREVVPLAGFTRLPGAPASVIGIINVRGAIVTVVDGGLLLHQRPVTRAGAMVLIVDVGPRGVGLAVDLVADVRALRTDEGYRELDVRAAVSRVITTTEE